MTHWMCISCGYYFQGLQPPNRCPSCNQFCAFNDVTCYRPDCGGENNVDPLLVGATLGTLTNVKASERTRRVVQSPSESFPIAEIVDGLSVEQREKVRSLGGIETYEKNTVICTEGDESRKLYLVEEGQVAVQSELGRGMRIPISIVSKGQAFGWSVLVPPHRLTATVTAASKTRVLAIGREPLLTLMKSDPSLGLTMMQNIAGMIASRLRNLELELEGLVQQAQRKL